MNLKVGPIRWKPRGHSSTCNEPEIIGGWAISNLPFVENVFGFIFEPDYSNVVELDIHES